MESLILLFVKMPVMEMRQLRSFLSLAKTGSLVRVGDEVHLSPAAVYKQLKKLENELGVSLYHRAGRKVRLTRAGEVLLPAAKSLLADHREAVASMRELAGKEFLRIGAGPAVGSYLLPGLLRKYRRASPSVEVVVESGHTSDLIRRLVRGSLDLVIAHSFLHMDRNVCVEKSWRVEFVIVTSRPQPPVVRSLRSLSHSPFVLFRKSSETQTYIDRYLQKAGFRPRVLVRFDNSQSVKEVVLTGSGLGILPFWTVDTEVRKGELSLVRVSEPRLFIPLVLLSRKSIPGHKAVKVFTRLAHTYKWSRPRLVLPNDLVSPPRERLSPPRERLSPPRNGRRSSSK